MFVEYESRMQNDIWQKHDLYTPAISIRQSYLRRLTEKYRKSIDAAYSPLKTGFLFSKKADVPSLKSSVFTQVEKPLASVW